MINRKQFIKLNNLNLAILSNYLKPREVVMFLNLKSMADWDKKHKNFNTVRLTIKDLKSTRLRTWSIGTIFSSKKSLIKKGLLLDLGNSRVKIVEEKIHELKQDIQIPENLVQDNENDKVKEIKKDIADFLKNK